jgi:hypothetical protein
MSAPPGFVRDLVGHGQVQILTCNEFDSIGRGSALDISVRIRNVRAGLESSLRGKVAAIGFTLNARGPRAGDLARWRGGRPLAI